MAWKPRSHRLSTGCSRRKRYRCVTARFQTGFPPLGAGDRDRRRAQLLLGRAAFGAVQCGILRGLRVYERRRCRQHPHSRPRIGGVFLRGCWGETSCSRRHLCPGGRRREPQPDYKGRLPRRSVLEPGALGYLPCSQQSSQDYLDFTSSRVFRTAKGGVIYPTGVALKY